MPKKNCDYSKTVMYKIVCNNLNITDCYVGHTTQFTKRKCNHKISCNNVTQPNHGIKLYKFIRENGGWSNWAMIEIEKWPCIDGNEARSRERHWYEQLNATLNSEVPNRSIVEYHQEYYENNKETYKTNHAEYYEKNKDKIIEQNKEKIICACGGKCTRNGKSHHYKTKKHIEFTNSLEV